MSSWVTFKKPVAFEGRQVTGLCIEGSLGARIAAQMGEVQGVYPLPYPADPRIRTDEDKCPSFCLSPATCSGRGSCPRDYACSE